MNRFLVSILRHGKFFDAYISAEDERTEEQFREQAKRTYPPEQGYEVIVINAAARRDNDWYGNDDIGGTQV